MRTLVVLAALAVVAFASDAEVNDPDVVVLTNKNFDEWVNAQDLALVEFYAPWCGHCKHLAPEYAKAATKLLKEDPPIRLGKVDATVEADVAGRFGVQGYPTLKVFRNGKPTDYGGPRDEAGIVKFMRAQAGPSAKKLSSAAEFDKFVAFADDASIVAFVAAGSEEEKAFTATANANREDYRFAIVNDEAIIKAKNNGKHGIVSFRPYGKGEEEKVAFSGDAKSDSAINKWLPTAALPLAGEYTADNAKRYAATGLPRLTLYAKVDSKNDPAGYRYYTNRLRQAASKFLNKLHFVVANREGHGSREYNELSFDASHKYGVAVISPSGGKFRADAFEKFAPESLVSFAEKYLEGKVDQHVKSEPIPTESGPVKVVVGKTFQKDVIDNDKDVFIEFYAPWCGHCKQLTPKWEKLAEELSDYSDTLTIANLDATANDYPSTFDVKGYPTIYLAKAGDKSHPVPYNGGREVKEMKKWLTENVKHKLAKSGKEL